MKKQHSDEFINTLTSKAEMVRACVLMTISHEGQVQIQSYGPVGSVTDFVFMEKSFSNWLSDVMQGRISLSPTTPPAPPKLVE